MWKWLENLIWGKVETLDDPCLIDTCIVVVKPYKLADVQKLAEIFSTASSTDRAVYMRMAVIKGEMSLDEAVVVFTKKLKAVHGIGVQVNECMAQSTPRHIYHGLVRDRCPDILIRPTSLRRDVHYIEKNFDEFVCI